MLCAVDVDKDTITDVLLVGAPMYMNDLKKEEGRVYLFTITKVKKEIKLTLIFFSIGKKVNLHFCEIKKICYLCVIVFIYSMFIFHDFESLC